MYARPLIQDIVFAKASLTHTLRANRDLWCSAESDDLTWSDMLNDFLHLKTFSVEVPHGKFASTHIAALCLGRALLEKKRIDSIYLLFRQPITGLERQRHIDSIFGPLVKAEDPTISPQCEFETVARDFDIVAKRPWAFEQDEPWFSNGEAMREVFWITRWSDTKAGSETYAKCITLDCDVHTNCGNVKRRPARSLS